MTYLTYDELLTKANSFDLLLFRGNDLLSSTVTSIERISFGEGDWSHVGLIIKPDILAIKNAKPNRLYVWESTLSTFGDSVDIITGKHKLGVQIRDLEDVIKTYKGKIGWCKLLSNPLNSVETETFSQFEQRKLTIISDIKEFNEQYGKSTYDYYLLPLLKTIFPWIRKVPLLNKLFHTEHKLFCSELVTRIYQIIGVINTSIDPESIAPIGLVIYNDKNNKVNPLQLITPLFSDIVYLK